MAYTRVQAGDDVTPEQINSVYDNMEKFEAMTAEATTLEPGSQATAGLQTDGSGNKKLALGLPKGAVGETGQDGLDGKSLSYKGEWSAGVNYANNEVAADIVKKDGNVYICKQNNQGLPPPNGIYWDLFVSKGDDGEGSGNLKGLNVSILEESKTYAIQAVTIPSSGGTLEGNLVEVVGAGDVERKLEKNFDGFYSEKTTLADNDFIVIQDSADGATPKGNKKVKISNLKKVKVNSAGSADTAGSATNASSSTNVTTNINGKAISTIFEINGTTVKNATNVSGTGKLGTTSGATSTTNRQPDSIFETNSNTVKKATSAARATGLSLSGFVLQVRAGGFTTTSQDESGIISYNIAGNPVPFPSNTVAIIVSGTVRDGQFTNGCAVTEKTKYGFNYKVSGKKQDWYYIAVGY